LIDGSKWIGPDSMVVTDSCHLTKEGNEMIVNQLINEIKDLGLKSYSESSFDKNIKI